MQIKKLWEYIAQSHSGFFIRGKKAVFLLGFLTAVSFFWQTNHNGDIIDRIWTLMPIWGTTVVALILLLMFYVANKRIKKEGENSF